MAALTDADRDRLREICEVDWVSATLARDWDANLALVSEDLVYMPPDHPVLRGKQEWVETELNNYMFARKHTPVS